MRETLVSMLFVLFAGCATKPNPTRASITPSARPAASAPSVITSPPATESAAPTAAPVRSGESARCLSPADVERDLGVGFKLRSELAVIGVAPDDTLALRERPGANERQLGALPHDTRGVKALGSVCRVGSATWFRVALGDAEGWANGAFLSPATKPVDETARFRKLLGTARFASDGALVSALQKALERELGKEPEPRFEAKLVGTARGSVTVALLHLCCFADDSVQGEQVWLELAQKDGQWTLARARASRLCSRGTSGDLCT
jgi:hypothetical protein